MSKLIRSILVIIVVCLVFFLLSMFKNKMGFEDSVLLAFSVVITNIFFIKDEM